MKLNFYINAKINIFYMVYKWNDNEKSINLVYIYFLSVGWNSAQQIALNIAFECVECKIIS